MNDIKKLKYTIDRGKIAAIIPARGGSKGVPRKNIKPLGGYPLIAYSIAACQLSNRIDRIVVSTDDLEIAEIARRFGAEVPFLRPADLAGDNSSDLDFVMHAIDWFQTHEKKVPEYLAHIRPTTPLRDPDHMDEGILKAILNEELTSLRSAHEAPESPMKWFIRDKYDRFMPFSTGVSNDEANDNRGNFERVYIPDGYIDVLKPECIIESGLLHGENMGAYVSPHCTEVDTQYEFKMLEFEISRGRSVVYDYLESNFSALKIRED